MRHATESRGIELRIRGLVQGVGFRPTVLRHARAWGIVGDVGNDGDAVIVRCWGDEAALEGFVRDVRTCPPPLSRIDDVRTRPCVGTPPVGFSIASSTAGTEARAILPDAAVCPACIADTLDPVGRRHRYPFTNCTACGPRYSIILDLPYDRPRTAMAGFTMCAACRREYDAPSDRRFHAQPNACPACGPSVRLWGARDGAPACPRDLDVCGAAARMLLRGEILAIKGIGGYHLACDATSEEAVVRLRARKHRPVKALALMARDLEVVKRYARVEPIAGALLRSSAAPIVLLPADGPERVAPSVAPGLRELGFMLPATPLHHLVMMGIDRPIVMTSGNIAEVPPCTDDDDAARHLREIADALVMHDRPIVNRVDDSVVRVVDGTPRVLRRARGFAPAPIRLPASFSAAPPVLAFGPHIKNTFCLLEGAEAVVSPHMGDLGDARTLADFRAQLGRLRRLVRHEARVLACDRHPEYASTQLAREHARQLGLPLVQVQHHHAHVAACLAEHGRELDAPPVLAIVLDGLGWGDDGTMWGGEVLRADYRTYERLASLRPVRLLGGDAASREPWRNLYAHLRAEASWSELRARHGDLESIRALAERPTELLDAMLDRGTQSPLASSCGRLFDAVAAAVGLAKGRVSFEGEAAMRLEAACDPGALEHAGRGYRFAIDDAPGRGCTILDPRPMWRALLADLGRGASPGEIAARFHLGLAASLAELAGRFADPPGPVALGGGVFHNAVLLRLVTRALKARGYEVLVPRVLPAGDGGVSLGQAVIAAALAISAAPDPAN